MKVETIIELLKTFDREKSFYSRYIVEHTTVSQVRAMVKNKIENDCDVLKHDLLTDAELSKLKQLLSNHIQKYGEQNTATGRFVRNLLNQCLSLVDVLQIVPLKMPDYSFKIDLLSSLSQMPMVHKPSTQSNEFSSNVAATILREHLSRDFWSQNVSSTWQQPDYRSSKVHTESTIAYAERARNATILEEIGYPDTDIPEEFLCPITGEIMTDPVRFQQDCDFNVKLNHYVPKPGRESHVFELSAISYYIENVKASHPLTREDVSETGLVADMTLRKQLDEFVNQCQIQYRQKNKGLTLFQSPPVTIQNQKQQNKLYTDKIHAFDGSQLFIGYQ